MLMEVSILIQYNSRSILQITNRSSRQSTRVNRPQTGVTINMQTANRLPAYNQYSILISNLYNYHCCIEILKILKFRTPISLHSLLNISKRNNSVSLLPRFPSIQFLHKAPTLWNMACKKLLNKFDHDLSVKLGFFKNSLKALLVKNQRKFAENEWHPDNFVI